LRFNRLVSQPRESVTAGYPKKEEHQVYKDMDKKISRRTLLKGAAVVTGALLASTLTDKARAAKSSKAAVKYQDKPNDGQQCSSCQFFIPGKSPKASGTCQVVEGSISPQGWCTEYSKKS
jgi:hypothetical protein